MTEENTDKKMKLTETEIKRLQAIEERLCGEIEKRKESMTMLRGMDISPSKASIARRDLIEDHSKTIKFLQKILGE